jgi:hypothetical protein
VRARRSGIPPKRATSGFLPLSRSTVTCRHLRGSAGVSTTALYLRAIMLTVERCLPVSVFQQRGLHDPVETAQAKDVLGQEVVLDETGVFGLVLRDDGEIVVVKQRAALRWPSLARVERAPLPDDGSWARIARSLR